MARWNISNTTSGLELGVYEGVTREEALDAMARDAGYESFADSCKTCGDDGSDIKAERVED